MPRARNTDPETSHAAARSVRHVTQNQMAVMMAFQGSGPMTDEQLLVDYEGRRHGRFGRQNYPKQSESGLRSRRSELTNMGYLHDTGLRGTTASGRSAIVWRATTSQEREPFKFERDPHEQEEGSLFDGDVGANRRPKWMDPE